VLTVAALNEILASNEIMDVFEMPRSSVTEEDTVIHEDRSPSAREMTVE
jgi:hypothetical protein